MLRKIQKSGRKIAGMLIVMLTVTYLFPGIPAASAAAEGDGLARDVGWKATGSNTMGRNTMGRNTMGSDAMGWKATDSDAADPAVGLDGPEDEEDIGRETEEELIRDPEISGEELQKIKEGSADGSGIGVQSLPFSRYSGGLTHRGETIPLGYRDEWNRLVSDLSIHVVTEDGDITDQIAYCIEPGVATRDREGVIELQERDESFWEELGSIVPYDNGRLDGEEMYDFIRKVLAYGYDGPVSESMPFEDLIHAVATQVLVWQVIVGERDEDFNHRSNGLEGNGRRDVMETYNTAAVYDDEGNYVRDSNGGSDPEQKKTLTTRIQSRVDEMGAKIRNYDKGVALRLDEAHPEGWYRAGSQYMVTIKDDEAGLRDPGVEVELIGDTSAILQGRAFIDAADTIHIYTGADVTPPGELTVRVTRERNSLPLVRTWSNGNYHTGAGQDVVTYGNEALSDPISGSLKLTYAEPFGTLRVGQTVTYDREKSEAPAEKEFWLRVKIGEGSEEPEILTADDQIVDMADRYDRTFTVKVSDGNPEDEEPGPTVRFANIPVGTGYLVEAMDPEGTDGYKTSEGQFEGKVISGLTDVNVKSRYFRSKQTSIPVMKQWEGGEEIRPRALAFTVYAGENEKGEKMVGASDAGEPWSAVFDGLPLYADEESGRILYTVKETGIFYDGDTGYRAAPCSDAKAFEIFGPRKIAGTKDREDTFLGCWISEPGAGMVTNRWRPADDRVESRLIVKAADMSEEAKPLPGARFILEREGTEVAGGITGDDGLLIFEDLDAGTYILREEESPDGYVVREDRWAITVYPEILVLGGGYAGGDMRPNLWKREVMAEADPEKGDYFEAGEDTLTVVNALAGEKEESGGDEGDGGSSGGSGDSGSSGAGDGGSGDSGSSGAGDGGGGDSGSSGVGDGGDEDSGAGGEGDRGKNDGGGSVGNGEDGIGGGESDGDDGDGGGNAGGDRDDGDTGEKADGKAGEDGGGSGGGEDSSGDVSVGNSGSEGEKNDENREEGDSGNGDDSSGENRNAGGSGNDDGDKDGTGDPVNDGTGSRRTEQKAGENSRGEGTAGTWITGANVPLAGLSDDEDAGISDEDMVMQGSLPKTGEDGSVSGWLILFWTAAMGMLGILSVRKEQKGND